MRTSTLLTALAAAATAFTLSVVEPPVAAHWAQRLRLSR